MSNADLGEGKKRGEHAEGGERVVKKKITAGSACEKFSHFTTASYISAALTFPPRSCTQTQHESEIMNCSFAVMILKKQHMSVCGPQGAR